MITLLDYLLLPLYLVIFYYIAKFYSRKIQSLEVRKYFINAFWLRMAGAILYSMIVVYYYGYGDSMMYFAGSSFIREAIRENDFISIFFMKASELSKMAGQYRIGPYAQGTLGVESNLILIRLATLFSYISFNCYLIVSLFMGFIAFVGSWKLYTTFNDIMGKRSPKYLAYIILYTPSIWFWGSGLLKESICMCALGVAINSLYKIMIKRKYAFRDVFFLLLSVYLLFSTKSYIAGILLASLAAALIAHFIISRSTFLSKAAISVLILSVGITLFYYTAAGYVEDVVEESASMILTSKTMYAQEVEEGGAGSFSAADFDMSISGLLLRSPIAAFTTLYRPFLWETRNLVMLFSTLESFIILMATLYLLLKLRVFRFFSITFSDPVLIFCFVFAVLMATIVGLTTFNFGTLVRYRLPLLPFYGFLLLSLYTYKKKTAPRAAVTG
jgi:hypothetical protein